MTRARDDTPRAVVGWNGVRFTVPGDWNVTALSTDPADGYLKVDSPGSLFLQVKWSDPSARRPRTLAGLIGAALRTARKAQPETPADPDLKAMLENYLKDTEKRARKAGQQFQCKVKPATEEAEGQRVAHHFQWKGSGVGQGKIWYCRSCRRTVIAQVVGQPGDPVSDVAAGIFGDLRDHAEDGWVVWAAFDLVAAVPERYLLRSHQFLSGYLKLDLSRPGEGRVLVERWGLAHVARKKFTLQEWLRVNSSCDRHDPTFSESSLNGHGGVVARGQMSGLFQQLAAWRDALPSLRPATVYEAAVWECDESNKIYLIQSWRPKASPSLLGDLVARCECH